MRIHMVTPKAPVRVTLNPRVQPAPNAPIFIANTEQPIALTQSAYWMLRLPYPFIKYLAVFFRAPKTFSNFFSTSKNALKIFLRAHTNPF